MIYVNAIAFLNIPYYYEYEDCKETIVKSP